MKRGAHHVEGGAAAKVGGRVAGVARGRAQRRADSRREKRGGRQGAVADVGAHAADQEGQGDGRDAQHRQQQAVLRPAPAVQRPCEY